MGLPCYYQPEDLDLVNIQQSGKIDIRPIVTNLKQYKGNDLQIYQEYVLSFMHYSTNKQKDIPLSELHLKHLLNIAKQHNNNLISPFLFLEKGAEYFWYNFKAWEALRYLHNNVTLTPFLLPNRLSMVYLELGRRVYNDVMNIIKNEN